MRLVFSLRIHQNRCQRRLHGSALGILQLSADQWPNYGRQWSRLHVRCQRRILHISWHDFVSNDEVLSRTGLLTSHTSSINEDWASLVMSPDFEVMFRQTRSSESAPRRGTVSGLRRSGDVPAADHLPPVFTRSVVKRVYQRPRPCC